jgi:Kef-type K+ transport system membrane component KefB
VSSPALGALALLAIQAAVVFVASRLGGAVFRRMGQPVVMAEMMAGIALGPSLLGLVAPGATALLFPPAGLAPLRVAGQVALIVYMFVVGLEIDPTRLRKAGRSAAMISQAGIGVPLVLGGLLGSYLYAGYAPPRAAMLPSVAFMAVAMSVTAFPVLARILQERGLLATTLGTLAMTCAAVDDVSAWCLLAFVESLAKATGPEEAARAIGLTIAYVAVMLLAVRPALAALAARRPPGVQVGPGLLVATLLAVALSSWVTQAIGIHALFGAFLLGAVVPREGGLARSFEAALGNKAALLLPLFFAFSGLRTSVGLLDSRSAWAVCGLICFVACAGKLAGTALAARATGLDWHGAGTIGILMNTRGLMELVVLNVGLDLGVITPVVFTMMVVMALATTLMTGPLLSVVWRPEPDAA